MIAQGEAFVYVWAVYYLTFFVALQSKFVFPCNNRSTIYFLCLSLSASCGRRSCFGNGFSKTSSKYFLQLSSSISKNTLPHSFKVTRPALPIKLKASTADIFERPFLLSNMKRLSAGTLTPSSKVLVQKQNCISLAFINSSISTRISAGNAPIWYATP